MMFSFDIAHLPTVDSTQDEVLRRLRAGTAQKGTVICADEQTKGRGRQGRAWETRAGGNLAATLLWPILDPARMGDYSLIVAIAMQAAVSEFLRRPETLKIKWPNDLMLDGVKCAGILLESPEPGWILMGTGVNVAHAPSDRACVNAGSDHPVDAQKLLARYLEYFSRFEALYQSEGMGRICSAWMRHAYGVGQKMTVRTMNTEFDAVFEGLNDNGACRARMSDGSTRLVHAGDVFFQEKSKV